MATKIRKTTSFLVAFAVASTATFIASAPAQAWTESCEALTVSDADFAFVDNYRNDCSMVQARAYQYWGSGVYTRTYGPQSTDESKAKRGTANSISSRSARALPAVGWSNYLTLSSGTTYARTFVTNHA